MIRAVFFGLFVSGLVCGSAAAQADDKPTDAATELAKAYQKKMEYVMQLRRENEERMAKLDEKIEKLDKELMGFETGKEFGDNLRNTVFQRYTKERELLKNAVLANPEDVKGQIETGRALNVMLISMGELIRRQKMFGSQIDPEFDHFRKMASDILNITPEDTKSITLKTNAPGEKLTLAMGADHPLKFELLPALLRREPFLPLVKKLEKAGDRALEDLRGGEPVKPESEAAMLEAMNDVVAEYTKFVRETRTSHSTDDISAALRAQSFIRNLKGTTRIFSEASRVQDVQAPKFAGGPFDDFLLHMTTNNLRFGPATNQRQREYYMKLFYSMRLYFYDLAMMDRLRTASKEELASLKVEQKALTETLYDGKAEQAIKDALQAQGEIERWGAIREAMRLGVSLPAPPAEKE